jgi:predicted DsbA family dithiol-disulfide isomerase
MTIEIEIFSDVICPWCFIGKRRLDQVLATDLGVDVVVRWRPYQLYPDIPPEGLDREAYLVRRYGADADRARVPSRIAEEAGGEGIVMRYDRIDRMPNTLPAHRLLDWSYASSRQHELADALFEAYFCAGNDVGDLAVLASIAASVGLSESEALDYLESEAGADEVRAQLERGIEKGVTGVPGYLIAGGFLLPGAQTSETMGQVLARVKQKVAERAR